jgi:hypothetical protein
MTTPTESEITAKMQSAQVTRAWAIIMLQEPVYTEADYRADYERMKRETDEFTGAWATSTSGIQCYAATPALAEARAARMDADYQAVPDFTLDDVEEIPY